MQIHFSMEFNPSSADGFMVAEKIRDLFVDWNEHNVPSEWRALMRITQDLITETGDGDEIHLRASLNEKIDTSCFFIVREGDDGQIDLDPCHDSTIAVAVEALN